MKRCVTCGELKNETEFNGAIDQKGFVIPLVEIATSLSAGIGVTATKKNTWKTSKKGRKE